MKKFLGGANNNSPVRIAVLAGLIAVIILAGCGGGASDFETQSGESTTTIVKYIGSKTEVKIPAKIKGKRVIAIGNEAFANFGLTKVTIPDSVLEIGEKAFYANNLASVALPGSVTKMGAEAFGENPLTDFSLTIANGVTTIKKDVYANWGLTAVTIPDSVKTIEGATWDEKGKQVGLGAFESNKLTSLTLGNGVTTIGGAAFYGNQLESLALPDSVTTIERSAFNNNKLTSLTLGSGVTSIGSMAFRNNQLTSVVIPDTVTKIAENTFADNPLSGLTYSNGIYLVGKLGPTGGIVFYDKGDTSDGWRYLEAAPASTEFSEDWKDAVIKCKAMMGGVGGWRLPTKDELNLMYTNLKRKGLGGFSNMSYWSSTQGSGYNVWIQDFSNGVQRYTEYTEYTEYAFGGWLYSIESVRAVRAF
jgi:hypothetical protein